MSSYYRDIAEGFEKDIKRHSDEANRLLRRKSDTLPPAAEAQVHATLALVSAVEKLTLATQYIGRD